MATCFYACTMYGQYYTVNGRAFEFATVADADEFCRINHEYRTVFHAGKVTE